MSYYFIADIQIKDYEEYKKYLNQVNAVSSKFNRETLVADDEPKVIEGKKPHHRTVVIRFETEADFEEWYYSKEYQQILKHRLKAADCDTILVKGK